MSDSPCVWVYEAMAGGDSERGPGQTTESAGAGELDLCYREGLRGRFGVGWWQATWVRSRRIMLSPSAPEFRGLSL